MHRLLLASLMLVAGCQNIVGPFARRDPQRVDDPLLSIGEQQRRGRDRLALPEESPKLSPPTAARPGAAGFDRSLTPGG
jgi:hypothetical protein